MTDFDEISDGHDSCQKLRRTRRSQRLQDLINDPPLLVSVADTMALVGYRRTKVFKMLSEGTLQRVKCGRSTRVTMKSILAFVGGEA